MPPKTNKKKSSAKRKTARSPRSARTTHTPAEETIPSSREFLRQVIDVDPHFIFAKDREGRFILANQAVADAYGTTIEELIGKTDADFNPNQTEVEFFLKMDREVMDLMKERWIPEEVITDAAGRKRWLQTIKRPIIGKDGRANQVLGVSTDITERKKVEEALRQLNETLEQRIAERTAALRESERRLQGMLDHSPNLIFMKDLEGRYIDANKQFEQTFHLMRQDIIGRTDHDIFPPEQADSFRANDLAVLEAGRSLQFEEVAQHDDGLHTSIVWKFPLRRPDGTPYATCGIVTDITERRRAEAALREREALTLAFLDNSATIAWMKDAEGRHVYLSPSFERRFGVRLEDSMGKTDFELWPPEIAEQFRKNDLAVLRQGTVIEVVEEAHNPDSSRSWWLSHKFPYQDESGTRYVGGLAVDITENKQAEDALHQKQLELQQSQAQLQELASKLLTAQDSERQRIARDLHDDFSQRLAAVVLDMAALERRPPVFPELIPTAIKPMREEVERLASDLHNLAYKLHPSVLNHLGLQPAIEDYVRKAVERTGLRISLRASDFPDSIPRDWSTCLFRVFQESLQNVVKHAKATEVQVRLSGSSNGVGLSVIDNGKGFDARDKSSHQKGLGLTSMQERLRLLKGFFNIHSRPANGTKVCVWIPSREKTP